MQATVAQIMGIALRLIWVSKRTALAPGLVGTASGFPYLLISLFRIGSFIPLYEPCINRRELSAYVPIGIYF
jgi:hypothetical protein